MHTTKYVCMIMRIPVFWETSCTWIIVESCVFSHYGGPVCVCLCMVQCGYRHKISILSINFICIHILRNGAFISLQLMIISY